MYKEEWNSIVDVPFGHLNLRGLKGQHARDYLNRGYKDEKTGVPTWDFLAGRWFDHGNVTWLGETYVDLLDRRAAVAK